MAINRAIKAQKDFLTWLSKGKDVYIINNSFYGNDYFARKIDNLFLDKNFFKEKEVPISLKQSEKVLSIEECEPIKVKRSIIKAKRLKSNNYICYIDSRYLDYFNDDCYFEITGEFDSIKVYENNIFVGIICPFIMKG